MLHVDEVSDCTSQPICLCSGARVKLYLTRSPVLAMLPFSPAVAKSLACTGIAPLRTKQLSAG